MSTQISNSSMAEAAPAPQPLARATVPEAVETLRSDKFKSLISGADAPAKTLGTYIEMLGVLVDAGVDRWMDEELDKVLPSDHAFDAFYRRCVRGRASRGQCASEMRQIAVMLGLLMYTDVCNGGRRLADYGVFVHEVFECDERGLFAQSMFFRGGRSLH